MTIMLNVLLTTLIVSTKWLLAYRDEGKQTQFGALNVSGDWKEHVCRTLTMLKSPWPSPQPRLSDLFCRMFGIWGLELVVLYASLQGQPVDRRSLLWLVAPPARYQLPWRDYSFSPLFPGCHQELCLAHGMMRKNPKSAKGLLSTIVFGYRSRFAGLTPALPPPDLLTILSLLIR